MKIAAAEVLPGVASVGVSLWYVDGDGANATKKEMTNLRATVGAEPLDAADNGESTRTDALGKDAR